MLSLIAVATFGQKAQGPLHQPSFADKYARFQHFTMEHGLSNNSVSGIAQDDDGFLWFGTEEGINRFDGERFTSFFHRNDGGGLPSDIITQMVAIPGNRLLIGTFKGLCLLDTRHLTFEVVSLPTSTGYVATSQQIWKIHLAKNGQIWVSTNNALFVLSNDLKVVQSYTKPILPGQPTSSFVVRDILELPDGTIAVKLAQSASPYYSTWQVIDFQQQKIFPLSRLASEYGVLDSIFHPNNTISDGHQTLWYSAMGSQSAAQVYRYNWLTRSSQPVLKDHSTSPEEKKRNQYNQPFLLPDSLLFLQRFFGAPVILNLRDGTTIDLPQWKTSLPDGKGILNFLDRDGNLWLCSRFEGIYFLTLKNLPTTPMTALNQVHQKTMADIKVAEEWFGFICVEHAGKWVVSSGNGGLYSMDKSGQGVQGAVLSNPFKSYAYATDFAPDRGDIIWMNTLGGLVWYNPVSNTNGPLRTLIPGLDSLDSRFLYRDRHGLIWGRVRNNGVCYFDTRSRHLVHFPSKGENPPYPLLSATSCTEGPDNDMWFSFGSEEKYIVRWHRATGIFEKIAPINPTGASCTKAFDLRADPHGNLWLYAEQKWFVMDTRTLQVQPFGKENGLITNNPGGVCLDRDGNLWFATAFGLSRYDPRSRQLRTFYETDGLLSNAISNVELIDTIRNILFVSTDRGMCLFEPDKVGTAAPAPTTYITGLRVSDHAAPLPISGVLFLTHDQNDLRLEFTGINFINGPTNRYQYSLEPEGRAASWKEAGTDNFANFLNLAPGRYSFLARTANSDGAWGTAVATLSIVIYPPWWRTWTFQLSLLAALAALGWWFYRRQIRRAESREAEKANVRQQMGDLEMRALRSQMNPHFVFNALNSVQNFILKNDTREASRYLTKFARLMRLILENSESPVVPLAREIELLRYYTEMEALRFNHRFTFEFQIDEQINPESVVIPGMLIQPHIENAIWHGLMHKDGAGQLWVRFIKSSDNTIVCEIEDNGVGRERAAEIEKDRPKNHRSTGLANIRNRLELLNAQLANDIRFEFFDLHDEQGRATGTKVVVRMPMMLSQLITTPTHPFP